MTNTIPLDGVTRGASMSQDGVYRYRLWRSWGDGPRMAFVMLNPSTADTCVDDPTIRRCIGFAKRERYDGIEVINLYALRATKPRHLLNHPDPEGPLNNLAWRGVLDHTYSPLVGPVVAAWGAHGSDRRLPASQALTEWPRGRFLCLGQTADGSPRHPLYVRADEPLRPLGRGLD